MPNKFREAYDTLNIYAQAFGSSIWTGIGSAAVYSGKQHGSNFELYQEMTTTLKSLVQGFDVVLTSEQSMAKLDKADGYHCETVLKSTLIWSQITQDAKDVGMFVRRMRDLAAVFNGCNLQNPYAGVHVDYIREGNSSQSGRPIEWSASMFDGNWVEQLQTVSEKAPILANMTAEDMGVVDWLTLER